LTSSGVQTEPPTAEEVRASWLRLLSLSRPTNPAVDRTGAHCQDGQPPERLWFLQSTVGGTANRACTIPPKREIVCNVLSCELSDLELPGQNLTNEGLKDKTLPAIESNVETNTLYFKLNGDPLIEGEEWEGYKVQTPPSQVVLPDNNLFQVQPGLTRFAAYGFYVKLIGLGPGPHTLSFGGQVRDPEKLSTIFETAVNYNLTQL
jgi:hypothetical protein